MHYNFWINKNQRNQISKMLKIVESSIKLKLILSFLLILLLMSAIAIISFSIIRTYMMEEDQMIDKTILSNQIVISSKTITTITSGYILTNMPDYNEKKMKTFDEVNKMKQYVNTLKASIIATDSKNRIYEIKSLIDEYEIVLKRIYESSENNKLLETSIEKDKSLKMASWIQDTVSRLISAELSYQKIVKFELNKKANVVGLLIYGLILLITILGIIFAVDFSNRVGGDISRLAKTARKIADGDLNVEKFTAKSKDEVLVLAESFNYMVSQINKLINNLEEKVNIEKKLKEQEVKTLELSNLLNEAELKFLQSQINPHFLFNTMNTIASMAKAQKAAEIKKMIECVSDILRYNLKKLDMTVTLEEEYQMVKNYIFIQKKRFGDKIEYKLNIDENTLNYKVPSMILQPFVENAIMHGLEPKEEKGLLELDIFDNQESIVIIIKDNGVGIDDKNLEEIKNSRTMLTGVARMGIGINNVIRRLELVYGRNVVEINSKLGEGTEIRIRFDKEKF